MWFSWKREKIKISEVRGFGFGCFLGFFWKKKKVQLICKGLSDIRWMGKCCIKESKWVVRINQTYRFPSGKKPQQTKTLLMCVWLLCCRSSKLDSCWNQGSWGNRVILHFPQTKLPLKATWTEFPTFLFSQVCMFVRGWGCAAHMHDEVSLLIFGVGTASATLGKEQAGKGDALQEWERQLWLLSLRGASCTSGPRCGKNEIQCELFKLGRGSSKAVIFKSD